MTQLELKYELRVSDVFLIESLYNDIKPHEPEIHELLDPLNQTLTTENKYNQIKTFSKIKNNLNPAPPTRLQTELGPEKILILVYIEKAVQKDVLADYDIKNNQILTSVQKRSFSTDYKRKQRLLTVTLEPYGKLIQIERLQEIKNLITGHQELEELFRKANPGRRAFTTRQGSGFKLDTVKNLIDEILQKKHEITKKQSSNIRREKELESLEDQLEAERKQLENEKETFLQKFKLFEAKIRRQVNPTSTQTTPKHNLQQTTQTTPLEPAADVPTHSEPVSAVTTSSNAAIDTSTATPVEHKTVETNKITTTPETQTAIETTNSTTAPPDTRTTELTATITTASPGTHQSETTKISQQQQISRTSENFFIGNAPKVTSSPNQKHENISQQTWTPTEPDSPVTIRRTDKESGPFKRLLGAIDRRTGGTSVYSVANTPHQTEQTQPSAPTHPRSLNTVHIPADSSPVNASNPGMTDHTAVSTRSEHHQPSFLNTKFNITPPIWPKSDIDEEASVLAYVKELYQFKKLNLIQNDGILIFSSLKESKRSNLYEELSDDERTDINKFCQYLINNYGGTPESQRRLLDKISQGRNETCQSYFRRAAAMYFHSRRLSFTPNILNIVDQNQQRDITYYFLKGLRDNRIRLHLRTKENIPFSEIGSEAQRYARILKEENATVEGNMVANGLNSMTADEQNVGQALINLEDNLLNKIEKASRKIENKSASKIERLINRIEGMAIAPGDRYCTKCGSYGHGRMDCRANAKSRTQYNKQMYNVRRGQSFDQDRNWRNLEEWDAADTEWRRTDNGYGDRPTNTRTWPPEDLLIDYERRNGQDQTFLDFIRRRMHGIPPRRGRQQERRRRYPRERLRSRSYSSGSGYHGRSPQRHYYNSDNEYDDERSNYSHSKERNSHQKSYNSRENSRDRGRTDYDRGRAQRKNRDNSNESYVKEKSDESYFRKRDSTPYRTYRSRSSSPTKNKE